MASLSRKVVQQHNSLLIKLCDMMSPDDPAYKNFILCLQLYIPKGRLSMVQQNPLDVLVLMEERGILKVGKYQVLEKALKDSGYINVLDCLMMEEKSIARQMGQHSCSDGAMAGGSSNIEAVTASSIEPEDQLDQNIIKLEKKMIQEVEARISRKADQVSKEKMESGPKGQKRRLNYNQDKPASKKFMSKKQGTHGSMSTHRFRTEILTEAKKKHNQLYVILHDLITEDSFKRIIRMARTYIDPKTLEEVKDMFHLLLCLEVKGVVSVGKYDNLVEIMNNAGVQNGLDVVLMTARDIKDIQQEESEMSRLDAYIWNQDRIHLSPGKLHQTVLNQCLPVLLKDLDFKDILDYMTNEDLMDFVTMHDILEQRTASAQIMELIKWVQERDQDTYEKFKECLVLSKQTHLKDMLEEEEAVVAIEVNEKHEGTALGCRFSLDNIGKAWKSIKTELKDKFYPRSILLSFTKQGILSDDEAKAICPKTMREMSEEILQRVEENLPDAFFVLLKALRDTDQDRAAKMMIKIINGTYVSKTTEELSCIPSSSVVIENILDKDIVKQETQKPEVKTIKGDGNEFGDLEEGTATGCSFALEDIRKAWKSIKTKLLQEFYPKSIFAFFIKEGILSDEECQAMNEKTRREMTEEILQRVEEKLPDAFFVLLKALRDTDQDKAADMMIKIINGTYVSKTTAPVLNLPSFKVTMRVNRQGSAIDNTEKILLDIFKRDPVVYSFNLCSDILDVAKGSVIIRLHPRRKHALEILKLSCRHGGMKDFMLCLLRKRVVFASLPPGEISIDVEVCCDQGEESVSESTLEPEIDLGYENFEVSENPQVIRGNLLRHAGILLEEICPLPLKKTFIDRGILDKSFFENLKQYERRDRVFRFLDEVCTQGSEAAMLALVDSLKASNNEALAKRLCSVKKKTKNLMDTAHEDIMKDWKSIKAELLDEFYPKSILPFFVKRGILSDDEDKAIRQKKRREMSEEILQRVEEKLPDAFSVFLAALKDTDQDKAVDVMTKIINGTYVSGTIDQVCDSLVDVEVTDSNTNAVDGELRSNRLEVCIGSNDDDQVDDSLVEVVGENINTNDEDGLLWSCHWKVLIHKNDDDNVRKRTVVSKRGKQWAHESYISNEPDKKVVKYPHKHAGIGLKSGHGQHLCLDVQKNRIVSEEELSNMSSHIGKEWEFLGRVLGITEAKLEQIKEDSLNTRECIYQMLMAWKGLSAENATISVLQSAIQKSGIVVDTVRINNILDGSVFVPMGIRK